MIVFDLLCSEGHRFESWFQSGAAFERQQAEAAIECPLCHSRDVAKAPMAPNLATRNGEPSQKAASGADADPDSPGSVLRRLREHIEQNCDYVGATFPEEARRIFYGESDKRDIYGEASADEAASIRDEGIAIRAIPWMYRRNG